MPRLTQQSRAIAIGLLEAGTPVKAVARRVGVTPKAIRKLVEKFAMTGQVKDLPRSGRPRVTTGAEDRLISNVALRKRAITGTHGVLSKLFISKNFSQTFFNGILLWLQLWKLKNRSKVSEAMVVNQSAPRQYAEDCTQEACMPGKG